MSPVSLSLQPPPVPAPHMCGDESASPSVLVCESWGMCVWGDMGRDEGVAPGTESAFSLIPCPHPQETVPRERPIPWCKSWGPPIAHLQVSIPLDKGTGDGKVRGHGSHPLLSLCISPSLSPASPPSSPRTRDPPPGSPPASPGPQGPSTKVPGLPLYVCETGHPEMYVCVHRILGPVVYIGDGLYTCLAQHSGYLSKGPCVSSRP